MNRKLPVILAIALTIMLIWFVILPTIFYELVIENKPYFWSNEKVKRVCDHNFLSTPTNCKMIYKETGEIVTPEKFNKNISPMPSNECWEYIDTNYLVPCRINQGDIFGSPILFTIFFVTNMAVFGYVAIRIIDKSK